MKKISLNGLAEFMTSGAANQRKVLRNYKYPQEDEARARTTYYREARDRIEAFCSGKKDAQWLREQADALLLLAELNSGMAKVRLRNNVRAIRGYYVNFSDREFDVLENVRLTYTVGGVTVKVTPDLRVMERGRSKLVKFHFGSKEPSLAVVKILCQLLFELALNNELVTRSSDVMLLDLSHGQEYRGARLGARMRRDIEAACQNIDGIWDSI